MNSPAISVVMTAYNTEKYIKEAIESILNQTFKNFEFIIVDDGSTDNTRLIIEEYAKKDGRIKVIYNETNLGIVFSSNKAIKIAKGKYIAIMDSDDISKASRLEQQFAFMESNPKVGVCGTNVILINKDGQKIGYKSFPETDEKCKKAFFFCNPFAHNTVMLRRECFDEFGYYDNDFLNAQDLEIYMRFGQKYKLHNLQEYLVYYRIHGQNSLFKNQKRMIKNTLKARKIALKKYNYHCPFWGYPAYFLTWFFQKMPPKFTYKTFSLLRNIMQKRL